MRKKNEAYFSDVIKKGHKYSYALILILASSILIGVLLTYLVSRMLIISLLEILKKLSKEEEALGMTSEQVNSAAKELSSATQQQGSVLEETSAAVAEISAMVKKSTSVATEVELESNTSLMNAEKGNEIINRMIQSMEEINQTNDEVALNMNTSNQRVSDILNIIKEVSSKTKVINDIVFQTKILSFNASVEAARAGEHGKGFAVVAEEVGNLALLWVNRKLMSELFFRCFKIHWRTLC